MKRRTSSIVVLTCGLGVVIVGGAGCSSASEEFTEGAEPISTASSELKKQKDVKLTLVGTYRSPSSGPPVEGSIEITAYDKRTKRMFSVNSVTNQIEVIDVSNPVAPTFHAAIAANGTPNSVAVDAGRLAVASQNATDRTQPGNVTFYDTHSLEVIAQVAVGAVPDMITFTPNGRKLLVANEAEPADDYASDPEGSVSIINVPRKHRHRCDDDGDAWSVHTVRFSDATPQKNASSIRHYGPAVGTCAATPTAACFLPPGGPTYPKASLAQDLEPEYITVSDDGRTAWVTLQENNAIAVLDIERERFTSIVGLGFKDWGAPGNTMDASDRDGPGNSALVGNQRSWPGVLGMYQPDAIAHFKSRGQTYLAMANEGDAREWGGYVEAVRANSLCPTGDPASANCQISASWPGWALGMGSGGTCGTSCVLHNGNLGRLNVTTATGRNPTTGKFDNLYAFGARSFSIRKANGDLVFDSGGQLEQIFETLLPAYQNANQSAPNPEPDARSDDKGPEPEGLAVGEVRGRTYVFLGLERIGGVMVWDVENPAAPRFVTYVNNRNFAATDFASAGDLGPEGLLFLDANDSPTRRPLLVVSNEISGTLTFYQVDRAD